MQVNATNGIYKQLGASWCNQNIVDTYTCIQVQAYATNGLQKQLGTSWSNYNNVDTYTCKYMQQSGPRLNKSSELISLSKKHLSHIGLILCVKGQEVVSICLHL